jgi:hypothetical protein
METVLKKIGKCPICSKGELVEGALGYMCNYCKNLEDKCSFNIYHTYFGKKITEEIAKELIENGKTEVFHDLQKKDGTLFSAALVIDPEKSKIIPEFANQVLGVKCPNCNSNVEELLSGYACVNFHKTDEKNDRLCNFFVPKQIAGREIPIQAVECLCKEKITPFMNGFKTSDGKEFIARLQLNPDMKISFSNYVCKCPQCGGDIYAGRKAYNCSNYKNEDIKCSFTIWKEMYGRNITVDEVLLLCENKETGVLSGFRDKEGNPMERKIIIDESFNVKTI